MPMQIRRTPTVNLPPTGLAEGQLAVEMAAAARPNLWVGVPVGIDAAGRRQINQLAYVGTVPPANPAIGDLWWDDDGGAMYVWHDSGTAQQWVGQPVEAGPQGPQGIPGAPGSNGLNGGIFPDVATPGAYLREAGDWVPMTAMSSFLAAAVAVTPANTWVNGPTVDVGLLGTWLVMGGVTIGASATATFAGSRLWDGTTVLASAVSYVEPNGFQQMYLSGVITDPAGPLMISVRGTTAGGSMIANSAQAGNSACDSTITAVRIG